VELGLDYPMRALSMKKSLVVSRLKAAHSVYTGSNVERVT
jgi:hypothetical protein